MTVMNHDMPVIVPNTDEPCTSRITLPDLVSHCTFDLRVNSFGKKIGAGSEAWMNRLGNLSCKKKRALHGLKCGLLTAMCYPDAPEHELRVCCDYLNYLFHLDNISDSMDGNGTVNTQEVVINSLRYPTTYNTNARVGKMTKDYWRRILPTGSEGMKERFIHTFDLFFRAITQQAADRRAGVIPDLESYIELRRDTSGCKPCWALIEYANGLNIPDDIMSHPIIETLGEAANDLVTWSNDIFSYNVEQSRGDTHNMIVITMHIQDLSLQEAVDFVGDLCKQSIDRFIDAKSSLPSFDFGGPIDRDVAQYVQGLQDWIVGSLHWSFQSERYFGKSGQIVKKTRIVDLLPVIKRY